MNTPSTFDQSPDESLEAFHTRVEASRKHSRDAVRLLRQVVDNNLFDNADLPMVSNLIDVATMFPQEVVTAFPDAAAPTREEMADELAAPFADHIVNKASMEATEYSVNHVLGSYVETMSGLESISRVPAAELMASQFSGDRTMYNRAMFKFYR